MTVLVDAVAGDGTVGGALVLHLDQRALARLVGARERLGDHAVEPGALESTEPFVGDVARSVLAGVRCTVAFGAIEGLEQRPAVGHRHVEHGSIAVGEHVEGDERGGRLRGQPIDARLGGMDALQQRVEVEPVATGVGDDDLAVDDAAFRQGLAERLEQFGEVAGQRAAACG